jgi:hypothetical protein
MAAGHQHQLVIGRELHHLARRQQRPCCLLARHHQVAEPRAEPMAGIVSHRAKLGGCPERVRYPLGRALVIGPEADADMAITTSAATPPDAAM